VVQAAEDPVSSGDARHQSPEGSQRYDEAQSRKHVILGKRSAHKCHPKSHILSSKETDLPWALCGLIEGKEEQNVLGTLHSRRLRELGSHGRDPRT